MLGTSLNGAPLKGNTRNQRKHSMTDTLEQNDLAIEELMKDAITSYMLDSFEVEDRLKAAVQKIAVELLAEELAALREKVARAKSAYIQVEDVLTAA
jgi:histone H3/H4